MSKGKRNMKMSLTITYFLGALFTVTLIKGNPSGTAREAINVVLRTASLISYN